MSFGLLTSRLRHLIDFLLLQSRNGVFLRTWTVLSLSVGRLYAFNITPTPFKSSFSARKAYLPVVKRCRETLAFDQKAFSAEIHPVTLAFRLLF
ncbi:hypothetical protein AVEN_245599-1 [Araneus ventricosus]|uniref:Uncharacterized protein n=1 Tax=Araneus ventricosus TaxID=182803 RepID=A0A4Y2ISS1_ARAVE|nr:hypothetical protein AVEN_245599-1 [Araneus ventricosus]